LEEKIESDNHMKSAYELAMERLNKTSPEIKLTVAQKKQLAELDSKYKAKIAELEISLKKEAENASQAGEFDKAEEFQQRLVKERKALQAELEERKQQVRGSNMSK
jgi:hypothetical protein